MKFKRKPLSKISSRGKLLKECDALHFKILKLKRGDRCEVSCMPGNGLGRFHILSTGSHPRLRYVDDNILLVNWLPWHFSWHHNGPLHPKNEAILRKITELRGEGWKERLLERQNYTGRMDTLYLMALKETLKKELKALGG